MKLKDGTETVRMNDAMTEIFNRNIRKKIKNSSFKSDDLIMQGIMIDTGSEKIWVCLLGYFNLQKSSIKLLKKVPKESMKSILEKKGGMI